MSGRNSDEPDNFRNTVHRPTSRRGMKEDRGFSAATAMGENRPITASRNVIMRPPSAQAFARPPGTASRLGTGMMQPPKTGSLGGVPGVSVVERPITQQGVSGIRTAQRGPHYRQVLDKRYYEGLIQMKTREITNEIARLQSEIDNQTQQQATFSVYETRVKDVAAELTQLQGKLADYNLVVDKVNTGTDISQIEMEYQEVKRENERQSNDLNHLFTQNRAKQQQVQQLEEEIQNEKNLTEKLIEGMNWDDRNKYQELREHNEGLLKEIEELQQQLDMLNTQKSELDDKISGSQMKQEVVRLYHKLREREERKAALEEEERNRSTPAQEREQLLQRVKEDNAEMAAMDRQIAQLTDQVKKKKEELEQIDQDLEESQSDRHQKYRELKKREETMEQFLLTFEESKTAELNRIGSDEDKIVYALQQISKNLLGGGKLPSYDEFAVMKENLSIKQDELEKSKLTVEELTKEQQQLSNNLQKIDELEDKIKNEMAELKTKLVSMTEETKTLVNLDALRNEAHSKRENLMRERDTLMKNKPEVIQNLQTLTEKNEDLLKQLNDNETYTQLKNLEKKLSVLEQNNASIREFIQSKKTEMDYSPLKEKALKLLNQYNEILKTNAKKSG